MPDEETGIQNYFAYMNEQNALLNRWFEDPQDIMLEFELSLRGLRIGERINPETGKTEKFLIEYSKPKMNEEGINEVMAFIKSNIMNRNLTLSDITNDEMYRDAPSIMERFHVLVWQNWKKWEIDPKYIGFLILSVENMLMYALARCREGKEKSFLKKTMQEIIHRNEDLTQKKEEGFRIPKLF